MPPSAGFFIDPGHRHAVHLQNRTGTLKLSAKKALRFYREVLSLVPAGFKRDAFFVYGDRMNSIKTNKSDVLDSEKLKTLVNYDHKSGEFTWLPRDVSRFECAAHSKTWNSRWAWKRAGALRPDGYISICIEGKSYQAHRLAWLFVHGLMPEQQIDHINMNRSDNRIINLRDVHQSINQQNRYVRKKLSALPTGVCVFKRNLKRPYQAKIWKNGKTIHLGYFETADLAHSAYIKARKDIHPGYVNQS